MTQATKGDEFQSFVISVWCLKLSEGYSTRRHNADWCCAFTSPDRTHTRPQARSRSSTSHSSHSIVVRATHYVLKSWNILLAPLSTRDVWHLSKATLPRWRFMMSCWECCLPSFANPWSPSSTPPIPHQQPQPPSTPSPSAAPLDSDNASPSIPNSA